MNKKKMKDYQKEYRKNIIDEQKKNIKKLEKIIILLMNKNKNIKIIKNNIEKIRPINKNKN